MTVAELPRWLVDQITLRTGAPPRAEYLERRRCARCQAMVLVGHDGPWAAMAAVVDPTPLVEPVEEDRAISEGRKTYGLRRRDRRLYLRRRSEWNRVQSPVGSLPADGPLGYLVVAEHRCWLPEGVGLDQGRERKS